MSVFLKSARNLYAEAVAIRTKKCLHFEIDFFALCQTLKQLHKSQLCMVKSHKRTVSNARNHTSGDLEMIMHKRESITWRNYDGLAQPSAPMEIEEL